MPMNTIEEPVNRLTSSHTDEVTHTPAFKETAGSLTLLPELGANPLPRSNFRWGHPTPQKDVEVGRKWNRRDYYVPGTGKNDELVQMATTKQA